LVLPFRAIGDFIDTVMAVDLALAASAARHVEVEEYELSARVLRELVSRMPGDDEPGSVAAVVAVQGLTVPLQVRELSSMLKALL